VPGPSVDVGALLSRLGITAKREGRKWSARCPSPEHNDRTPSWYIDDEPAQLNHGHHHCYGCGFGGWPMHLVQAVLGGTTADASKWMRSEAVHVEPSALEATVDTRPARATAPSVVLPAGSVTGTPLGDWPSPPRRYLEARGIDRTEVMEWGLGYAVEGRLAGRVILPLRRLDHSIANYTARTYTDQPRKYLSAEASEQPDLGAVYGEQWWPPTVSRETLVVVEGAFDAIAVSRVTRLPVGALYGSNITPGQFARLATWKRLLVAVDPDAAGAKATALLAGLGRWVKLARVVLEGEDCAALAVRAPRELEARIRSAMT